MRMGGVPSPLFWPRGEREARARYRPSGPRAAVRPGGGGGGGGGGAARATRSSLPLLCSFYFPLFSVPRRALWIQQHLGASFWLRDKSYLPGYASIGRLCEKCDGKCVICDSYVRPCTLVRICDECNYGSYQGRCVICGGPGVSDAYYCKECTIQEKDRDGCPKIVNLGSSKTDLFYERKKYGFKKR
ncbi:PHD finger-like domain-containing protein 5A isoform X1 [Vidua macroura]|uniref:PHD finger-like domain-containing protein 5A isoform X1 n=1 Tax=Vidua macroura TaxID=187451 RepID=UPI0023A80846|nr:PHD finger-like domain-containing protein 5A isoform X1 [Vidua macroura]